MLFFCSCVQAGTVGFLVNFAENAFTITSTGSESAYVITGWTLDEKSQWQQAKLMAGNMSFLAPGMQASMRPEVVPSRIGLGRADPLLLIYHDQAGSQIVQLAWRQPAPQTKQFLQVHRNGPLLTVSQPGSNDSAIVATHSLSLPSVGIARLTVPFHKPNPPQNPQRHPWGTGTGTFTLDTGKGQRGAWLIHESSTGELTLQMVQDGLLPGQEQQPAWLIWLGQHWKYAVALLSGIGALLMLTGLINAARQRSTPKCVSPDNE